MYEEMIIVQIDDAALFQRRVNKLLSEGWRVLPRASVSTDISASSGGTTCSAQNRTLMSVVLYKD